MSSHRQGQLADGCIILPAVEHETVTKQCVMCHTKQVSVAETSVCFIFMGPCIVRYRGGIYDQQDATNSQYLLLEMLYKCSDCNQIAYTRKCNQQ
jgi:hypothetical protein